MWDGLGPDKMRDNMREAGQKIANTFRTFADKETVDYSKKEKKFSKTELVKKPFEAKKNLFESMERHLDTAIDKVNSLAKEPERMKEAEMIEPSMIGAVAEPEFQYGAEAFEEQYKELMNQIMKEPGKAAVTKRKER